METIFVVLNKDGKYEVKGSINTVEPIDEVEIEETEVDATYFMKKITVLTVMGVVLGDGLAKVKVVVTKDAKIASEILKRHSN